MSHVVITLNKWFGIEKLICLVDRHQSNGVEPTNKFILRHLRALIFDYRITGLTLQLLHLLNIFLILLYTLKQTYHQ